MRPFPCLHEPLTTRATSPPLVASTKPQPAKPATPPVPTLPAQIHTLVGPAPIHRSEAGALAAEANQHLQSVRVSVFRLLQADDQGATLADADLTLDLQEIAHHLVSARTHAHLIYSLLAGHEPDFLLRQPTPARPQSQTSANNPPQ